MFFWFNYYANSFKKQTVVPITELEQSMFCQSDGNLRTKTLQEEFQSGVRWQKIPTRYMKISPSDLDKEISYCKDQLKDRLLILGHHYQRQEVIKYADVTGDSYKLSKVASMESNKKWIIFCGVHFMAETADLLTEKEQSVILPNMTAGCSMADMAQYEDVSEAWTDLGTILKPGSIIPVTYMNSTASIKSICGKNNGIVCTSSNAEKAFQWSFNKGEKILFLPDQHLGRNTGLKIGIKDNEMVVWDPSMIMGGLSKKEILSSKLILWKGHCSVHTRFTEDQIKNCRINDPDVKVIVHPECTREVVDASDYNGSTEYIIDKINNADPNTTWAIGTEINLVKRLAENNPDKKIYCLDSMVCPCSTMYRIHPAYLLWILEGLIAGFLINKIEVSDHDRKYSRIAVDRMLNL